MKNLIFFVAIFCGLNLSVNAQSFRECIDDETWFFLVQGDPSYTNWHNSMNTSTQVGNWDCKGNHFRRDYYTPDGGMYFMCDEEEFGNLTIGYAVDVYDNSQSYEFCIDLKDTQYLVDQGGLQDITSTDLFYPDGSISGQSICGTLDLSNYSNGETACMGYKVKWSSSFIEIVNNPITSISSKIVVTINNKNDETNCHTEYIPVGNMIANGLSINGIPQQSVFNSGTSDVGDYPPGFLQKGYYYLPANSNFIIYRNTNFYDAKFVLGENSTITIPEFYRVKFFNCEFTGCSQPWKSIIVEGDPYFEDCYFANAITAVDLRTEMYPSIYRNTFENCNKAISSEGNSQLYMAKNKIIDCAYGFTIADNPSIDIDGNSFINGITGFSTTGSPDIASFENNTFENYTQFGVRISTSDNIVNLAASAGNENLFINNRNGVAVTNGASAVIEYSNFEGNQTGLLSWLSPYTKFKNCNVDDSHIAVDGYKSLMTITDNFIGTDQIVNKGVVLNSCFSTDITSNTITSHGSCVESAFGSYIDIVNHNQLSSLGSLGYENSAAVRSFMETVVNVNANAIFAANNLGGVCMNSSSEAIISGNNIMINDNNATNGVRIESGSGVNIKNNDVNGYCDNAVLISNSSRNIVECNQLYGGGSCVWVGSNADIQYIRGNEMDAVREVYTRSTLSPQVHRGNLFLDRNNSNIFAEGDAANNIFDSRFIFDSSINNLFEPVYANPAEMKDDQLDSGNKTFYCNNGVGAGYVGEISPNWLCQYLSHMKKDKNKSRYMINLYHIYAYYLKYVPIKDWPSCLSLLWKEEQLCGIKEISESDAAIYTTLTDGMESIKANKTRLESELQKGSATTQLYNTHKQAYDIKLQSTNNSLNQIKESLMKMICDKKTISLYQRNMIKAITAMDNESVKDSEKLAIEADAALCADDYGDGVHLARGIASLYNDMRYDVFDRCFQAVAPRSVETSSIATSINVSPNPAHDVLLIDGLLTDHDYRITLLDIQGKVMVQEQVSNNQNSNYELSVQTYNTGLYILNVFNDTNGEVLQQKIVIQH